MIGALNSAYLKYLPKVRAFRQTHLPVLFSDTVKNIGEMWRLIRFPLLTMGYNGHTNDVGNQVLILTETAEDKTAFVKCVNPNENTESGEWIAKTIMEEMEKVTTESSPRNAEDIYVGTVCDNVSCNRTAGAIIEQKYPKIFTPGCCTHVADLLMEDVCKITEIKGVIDACRFIAVFIKSYRKVKMAYKRIIQRDHGTMLSIFPDTRFSYADLTIGGVEKNFKHLQTLIDEDRWNLNTRKGTPEAKSLRFKNLVSNWQFFDKVRAVRGITRPLCKLTHHFGEE